ncbi:hypothetical protein B0J14DRAFT_608244 [Halenospora varia]|nr:hypothetical protein B0J14DRAFT_608244 [Halenospora varia]
MLNEEHLDHRASQEALTFERERHKETMELLERVMKEAIRSGEVADTLGSKLTELQAALNFRVVQAGPQTTAQMEVSLSTSLTPPEASASTKQQSHLAETLPGTYAISSPGQKHSSPDEQVIQTLVVEVPDELNRGSSFPFYSKPLPSTSLTSSTSCARGSRRSKPKSIRKKRAGLKATS